MAKIPPDNGGADDNRTELAAGLSSNCALTRAHALTRRLVPYPSQSRAICDLSPACMRMPGGVYAHARREEPKNCFLEFDNTDVMCYTQLLTFGMLTEIGFGVVSVAICAFTAVLSDCVWRSIHPAKEHRDVVWEITDNAYCCAQTAGEI